MTNSTVSRYWHEARAPRYSLSFAFPLLVAYEVLAFTLSGSEVSGVRNGADVLLKSLFLMLMGQNGDRGLPGGKPNWGPAGRSALDRVLKGL